MDKQTALDMLIAPPDSTKFLGGLQLDVLKDGKLLLDVGIYKSVGRFIVTFNAEHHAKFNRLFFKSEREDITETKANTFIHTMACSFNSEIIGTIATAMLESRIEDIQDFKTIYIGAGVPACIMMMVAAASPPHFIFSFGMPAFSNGRPYREIESKAYDRKVRLGKSDEYMLKQKHYILPTDGTFRVNSEYTPPVQQMASHRCPTQSERLKARLTTMPRLGLNLKHHANITF